MSGIPPHSSQLMLVQMTATDVPYVSSGRPSKHLRLVMTMPAITQLSRGSAPTASAEKKISTHCPASSRVRLLQHRLLSNGDVHDSQGLLCT